MDHYRWEAYPEKMEILIRLRHKHVRTQWVADTAYAEFIRRYKIEMKRRKLTQKDIGDILGVSACRVNVMMKQNSIPAAIRLASALDCGIALRLASFDRMINEQLVPQEQDEVVGFMEVFAGALPSNKVLLNGKIDPAAVRQLELDKELGERREENRRLAKERTERVEARKAEIAKNGFVRLSNDDFRYKRPMPPSRMKGKRLKVKV